MSSGRQTSGADSQGRATEQVDQLVAGDRRARELVESLGGDGSGAAELAAMIAPPHDPADIDAMRAGGQTGAAPEPSEDPAVVNSTEDCENRWVDERGALTDGLAPPS